MEAKRPKRGASPEEAQEPQNPPSGPVQVFRIDDVSASVFARARKARNEDVTFYSVSFSRSYKDAAGAWKYTKNFDADDLGKLATLIQQTSEFVHERRNGKA